jgi:hypothetical protein
MQIRPPGPLYNIPFVSPTCITGSLASPLRYISGSGRKSLSSGDYEFVTTLLSRDREEPKMNLAFWLPAMFFLGLASMGLCYLFLEACEKI